VHRLTGLDASFLYNETPTLHMHTLKLAVLDVSDVSGGYTFDRFRDELQQRLHLLPPFRRRVVQVPGGLHHPVWIEDPDFDLEYHIRRIGVPPPGGRREIDDVVAEIASWQLDRSRPLWELWVLEGLAEPDRVGFLVKMHHAMADGVAAAELLANVMSPTPDTLVPLPPRREWLPDARPGAWRLILDALADAIANLLRLPSLFTRTMRNLRAVSRRRREADVSPPLPILHTPRTPFNAALTPHRSFATATMSLSDVKAVRAAFGVTVNDVVLGVVAGALRAYLERTGSLPDRPLVAGVPIGTDAAGSEPRLAGNKVSNLFTSLRTDIADPVERLAAIHEVTGAAKEVANLLGVDTLADWVEYTPPRPYAFVMRAYSRLRIADRHRPPINCVVSNVPGPREPLYVAGARMESIYSVGPVLEGIGLNVTVWSYLDQLNVGVVACREHLPRLWEITDALHASLAELVDRAKETVAQPT
jgi:diacylglycerol O-acyltransferase / wax synthase